MSDKLKEALSAVIDGEADEFELRRVLDEVGKNPELKRLWDRYHLMGAQLRRERIPAPADLADRVWAAVVDPEAANPRAAEASAVSPATAPRAWRRWGGAAVAATVAIGVMIGVQNLDLLESTQEPPLQALNIEGPVIQLTTEASASDVQRANAYILHHVQQRAMNAPGMVSFVKLAAYEDASGRP